MDIPLQENKTQSKSASYRVIAPGRVPLVEPGDDLARIILAALTEAGETLADGDVLVLAQKIVSKSEGRYRKLHEVTPSARALELGAEVEKDPRLVELILSESTGVAGSRKGVLVVAHRLGLVLANAGIDSSNVEHDEGIDGQRVLLLPKSPDASCRALCAELLARTGRKVAVIINDSLGRAWRNGTVGAAIGAAGITALMDLNGRPDLFDRPLQATHVALADELAAAASIAMGQADEGRPVVLIRGLDWAAGDGNAGDLVRDEQLDLFR